MGLQPIQLKLSNEMLEGIDRAIEIGAAANRTEFIRNAISLRLQDLSIIEEMKKRKPQG